MIYLSSNRFPLTIETEIMGKYREKTTKIGSSARRKRQQLLSDILAFSSSAFMSQAEVKRKKRILDLVCGTGETTLLLSTMMGSGSHITGLDSNESQLHLARQIARKNGKSNIEFRYHNTLEWKEELAYDMVYNRHFFHLLKDPVNLLDQVFNSLRPGGVLMVEELDFTKLQCFPNSFAFDRFVELYAEAIQKQGGNPNIGNELQALFEQVGFQNCRTHLVLPKFLSDKNKQLASLTLESMSGILKLEKLVSTDELHVLISELKEFESSPDTMITMPSICQVIGQKIAQ